MNLSIKDRYMGFCESEELVSIFSQPWWLDSVAGENNWNVCLVEKGGEIVASMPYVVKSRLGFKLCTMPKLTQTLGPYIKYPKDQKYCKKLAWEKKIMTELISDLPSVDYFCQNFDNRIVNWLPFFWKGFEQTTKYSYVIEGVFLEDLIKNLDSTQRSATKKAKNLGIKVYESNDFSKFYALNKKNFESKGVDISYDFNFLNKIYSECKKRNAVKLYFAEYNGEIIAADLLVYDNSSVYYLMGAVDPIQKNLGGMNLVLFESIKFAIESGRVFDFEGSMIESIEKYFRSFGAKQKPYFSITNTSSILLRIRSALINS